jgi:hypothetical protein
MENPKIILELTINEAEILRISIASSLPTLENEMVSIMLYNRLMVLIKKACDNESL